MKMKKLFYYSMLMFAVMTAITSCSDDDKNDPVKQIKQTKVGLEMTIPQELSGVTQLKDIQVKFYNVTTGRDVTFNQKDVEFELEGGKLKTTYRLDSVKVAEGLYNIDLDGTIVYADTKKPTGKLHATAMNLNLVPSAAGIDPSAKLEGFLANVSNGFVISEICVSGPLTPKGKQYIGDAYFRITNNSDETLYADGLFIAESEFNQMLQQDYKPDVRSTYMPIDYLTRVPGTHGVDKKYPVKPGESILICDNAINHKDEDHNPNSWDLSKANFEWYDESTNPAFTDIDNPDVENTIRLFTTSLTIWIPHNRGFKSYAIGFLTVDDNTFKTKEEYKYDYSYTFVSGSFKREMNFNAMKIPNTWIIDAVNLAIKDQKKWDLIDPSLDYGYTWVCEVDRDKNRYGKAVRRKFNATTKKLQDTNNSEYDFETVKADPFHVFK